MLKTPGSWKYTRADWEGLGPGEVLSEKSWPRSYARLWYTYIGILTSATKFVHWAETLLVWSIEGNWDTYAAVHVPWQIFHKVQTKLYQAIVPFSISCKSCHVCWQWFFTKSRPNYSRPSYPFLPLVTPSMSSLYYSSLLSNSLLFSICYFCSLVVVTGRILYCCCQLVFSLCSLHPMLFLHLWIQCSFFHFSAHWWFCP